ncbi:unnamed protein product [Lactuca virosa]|uniref:ubiquitinyl hydrolase 1 n=1 Tax=Lactuca virosa TaxID=75947 RepID=A0AAU9NJ81_9ASTR|nr:unnamed protein product [Lactuca virosa]
MANYTLLCRIAKCGTRSSLFLQATGGCFTTISTKTLLKPPFQATRTFASDANSVSLFDKMTMGNQRKYYMLGGKGGVGKTSCAASLAVKFANHGHPTIVLSTDPAHSLSDSFDQDLTGGTLVPIQGLDSPLFGLEINLEKTKEDFRSASQNNGGAGVKDFMDSMGLGMVAEQLGELKLAELLDTPPPGFDEAIAISKIMEFVDSPDYSMFTRIVFDTAPTGHTLRLLSLPDFMDASIGKLMKMKKKIASATSAIKSVFGKEQPKLLEGTLEELREKMAKMRDLFRDSKTTEFVIVTIPTVMAVKESSRLHASLKKENVPVNKLIVNQILPPSSTECKFCSMKRKDQMRAIDMIQKDPELGSLDLIEAPLVDVEIRGIPALQFMGDMRLGDTLSICNKISIGHQSKLENYELNNHNSDFTKMFTYGQDPDVVRWGLQLFDGGPYCGYGPQNYTDCYHDQYSREEARYHTECITTENDKLALQENTSPFLVAEASTPSCEEIDHSQSSFYLQDSLNQSMANYSLDDDDDDDDNTNDSPTRQFDYGEELSYSLELSDDEVGKRLNQMASVPHVPKVNGEIPSLDEATLDHQRLLDRLQLYQLVESKVQGDGNCQFRALSDQVYRTTEHHQFVRQQIVNQLKLHADIYEGYVPMVYDDYLKNMAKVGEWGDHVTLQAAADLYGIKVFVITSFKDTCYIEIVPSVQRSNRVIFLSFWAEVHYNSIYPVEDIPNMRP